jgi:pimeloyl-ACP methyl ester carboxylesterase
MQEEQANPIHELCFATNKNDLQDQLEEMYPAAAVQNCYDSLSKIADLQQYTTTNVVRDLEAVRQWLGYKKINLFGLSYGTRVALVYMKMFPSSIESCILWSPIAAYGKIPLYFAAFAQNSIEKVFADCRSDSSCHLAYPVIEDEFRHLMEKGRLTGFNYHHANRFGHNEPINISWNAFQNEIALSLILTIWHAGSAIYSAPGVSRQFFTIH